MKSCYTKQTLILAFLFASMLYSHIQMNHVDQTHAPIKKSEKHVMVVFIHGTMVPLPHFGTSTKLMGQILSGHTKSKKSWYQQYLDNLKSKSIYRFQPCGPDGLHAITDQKSSCIAQAMFKQFCPEQCSCYTFNWNGRLDKKQRINAGHDLYNVLCTEITRQKNLAPHQELEVVVLGHSHGGNVALNLAHAEELYKKNLAIDKLVLLGTPVQPETSVYIGANCFKKVYNFYSHGDIVQKLDIISTAAGKSCRTFHEHPKLTQIELSCRTMQPRHAELWFFGGKGNWLYRDSFPLSPFPISVFLPIILQVLDQHYPTEPSVTLTMNNDPEKIHFVFSHKTHHHTHFVHETMLKPYRDMITSF